MIKIILPAYNEQDALPDLFHCFVELKRENKLKDFQILLINDGSKDKTRDISQDYQKKLPLLIIDHKENKGLGSAIKTGFKVALKEYSDKDILVVLDADNTHDPIMINNLVNKVKEGYDIVIASRYMHGAKEVGLSTTRRFLSKMASFLLKTFFQIKGVSDYTCGFRAYKSYLIKKRLERYGEDFIKEKGFTCMAEILIKLSVLGAKIAEVPLVLRYDLKQGKSKINILRTVMRYCLLMTRKSLLLGENDLK